KRTSDKDQADYQNTTCQLARLHTFASPLVFSMEEPGVRRTECRSLPIPLLLVIQKKPEIFL
ncbi:MAG: hypothetical protein NTW33_05070, partial [Methanoregula sp.]|nr:hypothetical protein [Methanoregula sp.]